MDPIGKFPGTTNSTAAIKQATANIVRATIDSEMGGNVKMLKAGNAAIERFSASMIDADTQALLAPYRNIRL